MAGNQGETEDLMRYDLLAQSALRQVVYLALKRVESEGLPGEHHFFIAFDTRHPGVSISPRLRGKYPEEMTIVIQHQFWNLSVHPDRFEIDLSFDNIPEKLIIPFEAVKGFFDPAVQFGLQFEVAWEEGADEDGRPALEESAAETIAPPAGPQDARDTGEEGADGEKKDAAKIVSLDSFRKK